MAVNIRVQLKLKINKPRKIYSSVKQRGDFDLFRSALSFTTRISILVTSETFHRNEIESRNAHQYDN